MTPMFENKFSRLLPLVVWERSNGWYQYVKILKNMSIWDFKVGKIFISSLFNGVNCVGNSSILRESPEKVLDVLKLYLALKLGSGMVITCSLASDFKSRIMSMYESFYTVVDKEDMVMEPCPQLSYRGLPCNSGLPEVPRQQEHRYKDEDSPSTSSAGTALVRRPVAYRIIQGAAQMCDKFLDYVPLIGNDTFPWMSTAERQ
ncbi:uncharacterized protein LOC126191385 [Schistocerca cancellata]|uniref:uncharacterized protein LOC126191385 n=1 Tax=Schistocerca cancellata TaxID=274614 RepID=UPI002118114E|nr:uncharacterized protein LOC126191385 [Schistocerca cancellata]XP_049788204.1 uncharacterized protein LOC126191385 [Schistocerca cancellata]